MIFGAFEGVDGDVEDGTPLLSAAISSRRVRTMYTCSGAAAEPPVVPMPDAAHPSFGGSVSSPRSRSWEEAGVPAPAMPSAHAIPTINLRMVCPPAAWQRTARYHI